MTFADKLHLDEANQKILRENRQDVSGFALFKNIVLTQFWAVVKVNWLVLIFCIPAVVVMFWGNWRSAAFDMTLPHSGNIGVGYPIIPNINAMALAQSFRLAMFNAAIMLPLIALAAAGLAGAFNVIKYLCWGMKIKIAKTFFRGVKNSYAAFIWMGVIISLCYLLIMFCWYAFDVYGLGLGLKVAALIGAGVLSAVVLLISMFVFVQASMFNLSLFAMLKNAFRLGFKFLLQNIVIVAIGVLSFGLLFIPGNMIVQTIGFMLFFMLAFSWVATVWTIYAHFLFDAVYDPDKKAEAHVVSSYSDDNSVGGNNPHNPPKKKSTQKVAYVNPKKGKKR